ncbi:MAG: hypothetical protein LBS90_00035 [Oscillospiraceae bacterium]|jgi:homocitrate synthase NifV|nr:hypothetical protein [Oscillospiraceae bacterium]
MIRITDRTLSCIGAAADVRDLRRFLELLIETEPDAIELSEHLYAALAPLPGFPAYVLRIEQPDAAERYPDVSRFICRNASPSGGERVRTELILGAANEAYTLARFAKCRRPRVTGLDLALSGNYTQQFAALAEAFRDGVEFCPRDGYGLATAAAVEWITSGAGDSVVTSFGGVGGFAPTEQVVLALRTLRLRRAGKIYAHFPEMTELFRRIAGTPPEPQKPVVGAGIFRVESGVHVDGIAKQPKCYEPYPPEVVGLRREIVVGKNSGLSSVRIKAAELRVNCPETAAPRVLARVKRDSEKYSRALTDAEFLEIVESEANGI